MAAIYSATLLDGDRAATAAACSTSRMALTPLRKLWIAWQAPGSGNEMNSRRHRRGLCRHGRRRRNWRHRGVHTGGPCSKPRAPSAAAPARVEDATASPSTTASTSWSAPTPKLQRLMRLVGADPDRLLRRTPLRFEFPGQFLMSAPRLPAPLHTAFALLLAKGLDWREKRAAIRLMQDLQAARFRVEPDVTVTAWLDRNGIPPRQRRFLWEPLCIAALNTPAERASAQVMANVLRDSLAGARAASDMLLPQVDLSALFPLPAARFIGQRGGTVHSGTPHRVAAARRRCLDARRCRPLPAGWSSP
jgi:hypothetical protein